MGALSVFHSESLLRGTFVWARRAANNQKRRFPARAVRASVRAEPGLVLAEPVVVKQLLKRAKERGAFRAVYSMMVSVVPHRAKHC